MPALKQYTPLPVKGIDFSKPATFLDPANGFPKNMRYYRATLRKRPGKSDVGSVVEDHSPIMGLGLLDLGAQGIKYAVRNSRTRIEKFNTSLLDWESISNTPFAGGADDYFSYATVTESGLLIITNFIDRIRKWDGSGNTALLGGNPPKAKYCTYLSPYLIIAYVDDGASVNPWKVQWCDTDNPEVWSGGNSGEELLSDEPSPIRNIKKLNDFVVVYKKDSIWLGRKVDPPDIFQFDMIKTGIGLAASRALAEAEGKHYFMGANDFYSWNGIREVPIGGTVRALIFDSIDRSKIDRCFAEHVQEETEIHFYVLYSGEDYPKHVWKYNYREDTWFEDTCDEITCALKWERINTQSWDTLQGSWDQLQGSWDSSVRVASWEDILLGRSDGGVGKIDYTTTDDFGIAVNASFDTKDFTGQRREYNQRWCQLDVWARGPGKLFVDYSIDGGFTWVNVPYTSSQAYVLMDGSFQKYEWYFDVINPFCRFRLRNAVSRETFYVEGFLPYSIPQEEIKTYRA